MLIWLWNLLVLGFRFVFKLVYSSCVILVLVLIVFVLLYVMFSLREWFVVILIV